jgi:uncharacterized membrane protein
VKANRRGDNGDEKYNPLMILSKLKTKWIMFTQSILYLPVLFAIGAAILFLLTSRLDELYYQKITLNIPYLESLVFAGSSDAARSVLSTIAAGWATILGVGFSVTLITLQLSITKYTSHLVNRFEGDKINQFTLGWFIAIVTYSLLVLKTIRASEGDAIEGSFTPIIGVNIAVVMAIISLFVFVLFLKNISSYLRPNILVAKVTKQILSSLRSYEERIPDNKAPFSRKQQHGTKIIELRSRDEGMLGNINWRIIFRSLTNLQIHYDQQIQVKGIESNSSRNATRNNISNKERKQFDQISLRMDLIKSMGDNIRKNETMAVVYICGNPTFMSQDQKLIDENGNYSSYTNPSNNYIKKCKSKILSSMEITQDRRFDNDPLFGIELLRSLAVKSAAMHDTDVVKSTITGLFKILWYALRNEGVFGVPFYIDLTRLDKTQEKISSTPKSVNALTKRGKIIIYPKEVSLVTIVKSELSIICNLAVQDNHIPIITHFINEYVYLGFAILDLTPPKSSEIFARTADWFSQLLIDAYVNFPDQMKRNITTPLVKFAEDLSHQSPQAGRTFRIYFKNIIDQP